jgi:two-component system LytT family response regulator
MSDLRVLIVDDEPPARRRLRALLEADPEVTVVGECGDGPAAVAALRRDACDLVFLDVQMPGLDGLEVVRAVGPERMPAVVFVTAHACHAVPAFDAAAVDYLLKPFDRERFAQALERAKEAVRGRRLLAAPPPAPAQRPAGRLLLRGQGRLYFLAADEIDWVEAAGNYLRLHAGGKTHLLRATLGGLAARLDPTRFVRIHRSALVNLDRVEELQPLFHGDYAVLLRDGTRLTLSRAYRAGLAARLGEEL